MGDVCRIVIPGEPVSKERPRVTTRGTFTPKKTLDAERVIQQVYNFTRGAWACSITHDFLVIMSFYNGNNRRRDLDNMVKLVLDALNKICWADDFQVVEFSARKYVQVDTPRTEVEIHRWLRSE